MNEEVVGDEEFLTPLQREYLKRNPGVQIAADAPVSSDVPAATERPVPKAIGGWLSFLIASMMILGPLVSAAMTASELAAMSKEVAGDLIDRVEFISWLYWAFRSAILFIGGWFLAYRLQPRSISIAIGCLWLAGPVPDLCLTVAYGGDIADLVRSSIYAGIWSAYLLVSKRVKAVYFGSQANYDQIFR